MGYMRMHVRRRLSDGAVAAVGLGRGQRRGTGLSVSRSALPGRKCCQLADPSTHSYHAPESPVSLRTVCIVHIR